MGIWDDGANLLDERNSETFGITGILHPKDGSADVPLTGNPRRPHFPEQDEQNPNVRRLFVSYAPNVNSRPPVIGDTVTFGVGGAWEGEYTVGNVETERDNSGALVRLRKTVSR